MGFRQLLEGAPGQVEGLLGDDRIDVVGQDEEPDVVVRAELSRLARDIVKPADAQQPRWPSKRCRPDSSIVSRTAASSRVASPGSRCPPSCIHRPNFGCRVSRTRRVSGSTTTVETVR